MYIIILLKFFINKKPLLLMSNSFSFEVWKHNLAIFLITKFALKKFHYFWKGTLTMDFKNINIPMNKIETDCIVFYGYDKEKQFLDLEFNSGYYIYRYLHVPEYIVKELLSTNKTGTYFNLYVKNQYQFFKLKLSDIFHNDPHYEYLKI
jgi:hypothetical protein